MKKIRILNDEEIYYKEDVDRIVAALRAYDYDVSPTEARQLWDRYSESFAAGWLILPESDGEIVACLSRYFEAVDECCGPGIAGATE